MNVTPKEAASRSLFFCITVWRTAANCKKRLADCKSTPCNRQDLDLRDRVYTLKIKIFSNRPALCDVSSTVEARTSPHNPAQPSTDLCRRSRLSCPFCLVAADLFSSPAPPRTTSSKGPHQEEMQGSEWNGKQGRIKARVSLDSRRLSEGPSRIWSYI